MMNLLQDYKLPITRRESEIWGKQWWEEGEEYLSVLDMELEEPLIAGSHILVKNHLLDNLSNGKLTYGDRPPGDGRSYVLGDGWSCT